MSFLIPYNLPPNQSLRMAFQHNGPSSPRLFNKMLKLPFQKFHSGPPSFHFLSQKEMNLAVRFRKMIIGCFR